MEEFACPQCGHLNPLDANFCSVCGAEIDAEEALRTATHEVVDLSTDVPTMVVVRGANAGSRFALNDPVVTIGRHPDSIIFLDDVTVSRRHAEVRRVGTTLELVDVGSLNGTYVNGDRVESVQLAEGDQIQVGKFKLVVVIGGSDGD